MTVWPTPTVPPPTASEIQWWVHGHKGGQQPECEGGCCPHDHSGDDCDTGNCEHDDGCICSCEHGNCCEDCHEHDESCCDHEHDSYCCGHEDECDCDCQCDTGNVLQAGQTLTTDGCEISRLTRTCQHGYPSWLTYYGIAYQ